MSACDEAFERGLVVGLLAGVLALGALVLAASPTEDETLRDCVQLIEYR